MFSVLKDEYSRCFNYLRLSITDLCNFSCKYCLPDNVYLKSKDYLSLNEIYNLVYAFSELGVKKIRLTGGEPTIRGDFIDISKSILSIPGIESLVFTTNGYKLYKIIDSVKNVGFSGVNVSLDTLNCKKFFLITGKNCFNKVLEGIYRSIEIGLSTKINVVLSKFFTIEDFEDFYSFLKYKNVVVRFIEQMEAGFLHKRNGSNITSFFLMSFLNKNGWIKLEKSDNSDGPAVVFCNSNYLGKIGIINPYSSTFCFSCNRLRVSSIGNLYLCLFGDRCYSLRQFLDSFESRCNLKQFILDKVKVKNSSHFLNYGKPGIIKSFASIGG